jgi:DNA processing protein
MAGGYNRDVFAVPGRIGDKHYVGCNHLIKTNMAHLAEDLADIEYILGWERKEEQVKRIRYSRYNELNQDERSLIEILSDRQVHSIDSLCDRTGMAVGKVSALLLKLEFTGMVYCMPGNSYRLCEQPGEAP